MYVHVPTPNCSNGGMRCIVNLALLDFLQAAVEVHSRVASPPEASVSLEANLGS